MNKFLLSNSVFTGHMDMFIFSVLAVLSTVLMIFVGYKLLQMLQLTGYKLNGYVKWFKETKYSYISRLFMLSFLSLSSMLITNVLLADFILDNIWSYLSIIFYILFCSLFITNLFTAKQKTPLKYTKRMTRLIVVFTILIGGFTWFVQYIGYRYIPYLSFGLIGIIPLTLPIFVFLAYFITYPLEKLISGSYIKKAKKKLANCKNLTVVGITGSYGKTTVKNILKIILEEKFKVCASPSSYNTPLGIAKTILSNLSENDEVFIAEMGAKQMFDIKELCEIVEPKIGLITGVGNQHLLTFGSVENIVKTKGELAEFISQTKGKLFVNVDSELSKKLAENYSKAITTSIGVSSGDMFVQNIKTTSKGSTFELVAKGEVQKCETILLGEHNISNILIASRVAFEMGVSLKEISAGIKKLHTIQHRLEIVKSSSTYTIIDDAYNSSVEGSKASLNVLSKFAGSKFVITPGLVELGDEQYNSNFEFGKNMAEVCDYVIVDYASNFKAISEGLKSANFDENKIIQVANLTQAVELLNKLAKKDDVVLFENDLPDNYS
ncbi:MAG: hypothetical protein IKB06_01550 [Clostridia bacterium]|nr:hypothetical protein [Clostridia bacterium]